MNTPAIAFDEPSPMREHRRLGGLMAALLILLYFFASLWLFQLEKLSHAKGLQVREQLKSIETALASYKHYISSMRGIGGMNLVPTTEQGLRALTVKPMTPRFGNSVQFHALKIYNQQPSFDVPNDPWNHEFQYRSPAINSSASYDLWSLGPDGVNGTDDDIGNW